MGLSSRRIRPISPISPIGRIRLVGEGRISPSEANAAGSWSHAVAVIDTLEGAIGDVLSFHYDLEADVLYLRKMEELKTLEVGQEDEYGLIMLFAQDDLRVIGVTIVSFWKRFGSGEARARPVAEIARIIDEATAQARLRAT